MHCVGQPSLWHTPHPEPPPFRTSQEWESHYLLSKARRLRDATATLQLVSQASNATTTTRNTQAPAYVATRVEGGAALPEVAVEGRLGGGKRRKSTRGVDEGLLVREVVVRHVVEGLRPELARELVGF
jgi:hypothetical protein